LQSTQSITPTYMDALAHLPAPSACPPFPEQLRDSTGPLRSSSASAGFTYMTLVASSQTQGGSLAPTDVGDSYPTLWSNSSCSQGGFAASPGPLTVSSPNSALLLRLCSQKGREAAVPEKVANNQRTRKLPAGTES
jgi:hypothetical protein